jgi:hypothetical protein
MTGHIEAYGKQSGAVVGSVLSTSVANGWDYTRKPGSGIFPGGTASGGFAILAPEVTMSDIDVNFAPAWIPTLSTVYFVAGPSTFFGAGLPDVVTGGVRTGHRWGEDSSGNLTFSRMSSAGVATDQARLDSGGSVSLLPSASTGGEIRLLELAANGTNYVGFKAPDSLASSLQYVMPTTDPTVGQVLSAAAPSGGMSVLSWATSGGGAEPVASKIYNTRFLSC